MGHRQQMTDKQRREWDNIQYQARLNANRGHNYQYLTDELQAELEAKGYKRHYPLGNTTLTENIANSLTKGFRDTGHYARIVCVPNRLRIKTYIVYYKKK